MKRFQAAIASGLAAHGLQQQDLAQKIGITPVTVSRLIQGHFRPSTPVLRALCTTAWPDKYTGLEVTKAWLEDELDRTGRTANEVALKVKGVDSSSCDLGDDLRELAEWLPSDIDMRTLIAFMADAARKEKGA